MIRVRVPGGVCTPKQWLGIDELCDKFGDHSLKLTTRQAFQLYGVVKTNLKQTMKEINDTLLDTSGCMWGCKPKCNVAFKSIRVRTAWRSTEISPANPRSLNSYKHLHMRKYGWTERKAKVVGEEAEEPIYGKTYLPTKV